MVNSLLRPCTSEEQLLFTHNSPLPPAHCPSPIIFPFLLQILNHCCQTVLSLKAMYSLLPGSRVCWMRAVVDGHRRLVLSFHLHCTRSVLLAPRSACFIHSLIIFSCVLTHCYTFEENIEIIYPHDIIMFVLYLPFLLVIHNQILKPRSIFFACCY